MRRAAWVLMVAWGMMGRAVAQGAADPNEPYVTPEERAIDKQMRAWEEDPADADTLAKWAEKLLNAGRLPRASRATTMLSEQKDPRAVMFRKRIDQNTSIVGRWTFTYGAERRHTAACFRCGPGGRVYGRTADRFNKQIGSWEQTKPGHYRVRLARQGKSMFGLEFAVRGLRAEGTAVDREYKRRQTWPAKGRMVLK